MHAKLDCEKDTLDIPRIGCIQLSVNAVGHCLMPRLDFNKQPRPPPGLEHGMQLQLRLMKMRARPDHGRELWVSVRPKKIPIHPPGTDDVLEHKPKMSEVSKRSDKMARSVLLHLSKVPRDHGPWIQLPQELAAVHLILGRNGFISPDVPWQIRSAQIGYRSKIIRRTPTVLLREAVVLVMSLSDKTFRVLKDWTQCSTCGGRGQSLGPEASSARMFLFVFATN